MSNFDWAMFQDLYTFICGLFPETENVFLMENLDLIRGLAYIVLASIIVLVALFLVVQLIRFFASMFDFSGRSGRRF